MVLDHDLEMLLAAIDAGQDDVLPVLADWLEERGDERAAGLRRLNSTILPLRVSNQDSRELWMWEPIRKNHQVHQPHHLPKAWFDRLPPLEATGREGAPAMAYDTRSLAYLALAAALANS